MDATAKRKAFAASYVVDSNGKKAAIAAGFSKATAAQAASRLLKHPEVVAELKRLKAERAAAEKAAGGDDQEPLDYLMAVMRDAKVDPKLRVRAAIAAAQYRHTKVHDGGKKEQADERAEKAAKGRFGVRKAPSLKVVRG